MPPMKDFICDEYSSLSYTWGNSKVINSFSWLQGNVLPPQAIPTVFPCAAHSFHSWHRGNSHYYWESITLLLRAVPSAISPGESRVVAMLHIVTKPRYGRFLEEYLNIHIAHVPYVMSCPVLLILGWLMKEQTSWFLDKVFFSLISNSSRISRVRSLKLQ